jgi:hypothetical protein
MLRRRGGIATDSGSDHGGGLWICRRGVRLVVSSHVVAELQKEKIMQREVFCLRKFGTLEEGWFGRGFSTAQVTSLAWSLS